MLANKLSSEARESGEMATTDSSEQCRRGRTTEEGSVVIKTLYHHTTLERVQYAIYQAVEYH